MVPNNFYSNARTIFQLEIIHYRVLLIFYIIIERSKQTRACGFVLKRGTHNNETYLNCHEKESLPKNDWSFEGPINIVWTGIYRLWFTKNKINSFKKGSFNKFINVRTIDLSENNLNIIDFNEFARNSKLQALAVNKNQISKIEPIEISTIINITSLMIHNNDLINISELCKLKKVKKLDLSRNRRLDFSSVSFNCWNELTHLYLAETNMKNLNHDYQVLAGSNKLIFLDLSDNNLDILCFQHFPVLLELTVLNIRNNSLVSLDVQELKRKFQDLWFIAMGNNDWTCDYYEGTLKKQLGESKINETDNKDNCSPNPKHTGVRSCRKIDKIDKIDDMLVVSFWILCALVCVVYAFEIFHIVFLFKQFCS
jgi:Leucine rich repeat